jgi:Holliday junction DNA helicase RuvA
MITFLHGKLADLLPTQAIVEVHGVGYEVIIPLSSYNKLPSLGQEVKLLTHLAIREDAHTLYGFVTGEERDLFRQLIHNVSGIGPKIALNVLSGMSVASFRGAVSNSDVRALSQISGVGKKTAERIVVELRDKVGVAGGLQASSSARALTGEEQKVNDAVLALMALGTRQADAFEAVKAASGKLGPQAGLEELVRAALQKT